MRNHNRQSPLLFFENTYSGGAGQLYTNPIKIITAWRQADIGSALSAIEKALDDGFYLAGFFSYELGYCLEEKLHPLLPPQSETPLIWFGVFENYEEKFFSDIYFLNSQAILKYISPPELKPAWDEPVYLNAFNKVQDYIQAGDVYQVDLTFPQHAAKTQDPLALYATLRLQQPVRHAAYIDGGDFQVLSFSPERFFAIDNGVITARPMKGTAPRSANPSQDEKYAQDLQASEKQRAENLMIVDLMRNDFGRIAKMGSVKVTDLFTLEKLETLWQMTSGIQATLQDKMGIVQILHALFPCGSVVGAPKIRAMEIIHALETTSRSIYTGAVGTLSKNAAGLKADFNVAIRTLWNGKNTLSMGVGSGVVVDSVGADEYQECLLKASFVKEKIFQLFTTLRWEKDSGYHLFARHLERLQNSARLFDFVYEQEKIITALNNAAAEFPHSIMRVRLDLYKNGAIKMQSAEYAPIPNAIGRVKIADVQLDKADIFLQHKTSNRNLYDKEYAKAKAEGYDEVIFFNQQKELCEGAISTIFIEKAGQFFTPPLSCGLLAGTLRAELLATGKAVEKIMTFNDVQQADKIYMGNSLRGLMQVKITP